MKKFQNKYRILSARAVWWNYSNGGRYFGTICTHDRLLFFGDVSDQKMELSEIGNLAHKFWCEIPNHFPFVKLHAFVVMPNHMHGIIEIVNHEELDFKNEKMAAIFNIEKECNRKYLMKYLFFGTEEVICIKIIK